MMKELLVNRRWCESEHASDAFKRRLDMGRRTHISPGSTLVAAIGNHWQPGCYDAVRAMLDYTYNEGGYTVHLWEVPDRCHQPFDAMGTMRNEACAKAVDEGWEYLLMVDNDVKPPKDALVKLLEQPVPILMPITVYEDGNDYGMTMPHMPRDKGLVMVTSAVLSFVLFDGSIVRQMLGFWENPLGADELYHFSKLYAMTGHRPFVDTGVVVPCAKGPHFPLDGRAKA